MGAKGTEEKGREERRAARLTSVIIWQGCTNVNTATSCITAAQLGLFAQVRALGAQQAHLPLQRLYHLLHGVHVDNGPVLDPLCTRRVPQRVLGLL